MGDRFEVHAVSVFTQKLLVTILHLQAFSRNGEATLTYRHGLPGETWPEPQHNDPLSVIDQVLLFCVLLLGLRHAKENDLYHFLQVELAMAYNCKVSQALFLFFERNPDS